MGRKETSFYDERLPEGISIFKNDFDEYVACEFGCVAKVNGKNVSMSRTLEGAIQNYLDAAAEKGGE